MNKIQLFEGASQEMLVQRINAWMTNGMNSGSVIDILRIEYSTSPWNGDDVLHSVMIHYKGQ